MARKSFKELKERGYKLPWVAIVFNKPFLFVLFTILGIVGTLSVMMDGYASLHRSEQPLDKTPEYQEIAPKDSTGDTWAKKLVSTAPNGIKGWSVSNDYSPRQPFSYDDCNTIGIPSENMSSTFSGKSKDFQIFVQLYAPGYAPTAMNSYNSTLSKCMKVTKYNGGNPATTIYQFDKGFAFTYGDAIIFGVSDNTNNIKTMTTWYLNNVSNTLEKSGCVDLSPNESDINRDLYIANSDYKGLFQTQQITTTVKTDGFPTQVYSATNHADPVPVPESPLPKGFPTMPSQPFSEPTIPVEQVASTGELSTTVTYQIVDKYGPGCGWAWSGMKAPVVDEKALLANQKKIVSDAQKTVDANAEAYVKERLLFSTQSLLVASRIDTWNAYIAQIEKVNEKRTWLVNQRDAIYQAWETYVANHDNWMNFDNEKANAVKQYNAAVMECNAENTALQQWENQYGALAAQQGVAASLPPSSTASSTASTTSTPTVTTTVTVRPSASATATSTGTVTPTSTPTTTTTTATTTSTPTPTVVIPPKPTGCTVAPTQPSILNETKPAEPQPPTIPAGVTIPDNWDQPITSPSVPLQ